DGEDVAHLVGPALLAEKGDAGLLARCRGTEVIAFRAHRTGSSASTMTREQATALRKCSSAETPAARYLLEGTSISIGAAAGSAARIAASGKSPLPGNSR